ncbi:hypothetical protein ACLOJK_013344 [Asimina triloba]
MARMPSSPIFMYPPITTPIRSDISIKEESFSSQDRTSVLNTFVYPSKANKTSYSPPPLLPPPEPEFGANAITYLTHTHKIIAELVGTYILVFAGCGSALVNQRGPISALGMAVVWGLVVMAMVYAIGHISGAHINPAITIALAVCRKFPWKHVPAYVIVQVLGGILASLTLHALFGKDNLRPTLTLPQPDDIDTPLNTIVWEFIITFTLAFVVSGVATDRRAGKDPVSELAGVAAGATVLFNVLLAGQASGASMNPARSIGPAIVAKHYHSLWIYVVAPVLGAIAGAATYTLLQIPDKYSKNT